MQDRAILSLTRISTQPKNGCLTRSEVGGLEKKPDQHLCRLLRHAANSSVKHRDSTNRNAREIASRMRKSRGGWIDNSKKERRRCHLRHSSREQEQEQLERDR